MKKTMLPYLIGTCMLPFPLLANSDITTNSVQELFLPKTNNKKTEETYSREEIHINEPSQTLTPQQTINFTYLESDPISGFVGSFRIVYDSSRHYLANPAPVKSYRPPVPSNNEFPGRSSSLLNRELFPGTFIYLRSGDSYTLQSIDDDAPWYPLDPFEVATGAHYLTSKPLNDGVNEVYGSSGSIFKFNHINQSFPFKNVRDNGYLSFYHFNTYNRYTYTGYAIDYDFKVLSLHGFWEKNYSYAPNSGERLFNVLDSHNRW